MTAPITDDLEDGIVGKGFPIEVYNVLGAGDAFMSGFLRGWLRRREPARPAATWANACGAFAVSRLLCSPEYPTWEELQFFLKHGSPHRALRKDEAINHIHWATTRRARHPVADGAGHRPPRAARGHRRQGRRRRERDRRLQGAGGQGGGAGRRRAAAATACCSTRSYGREALFDSRDSTFSWLGRPVELPGSRPLRFEFSQDIGSQLVEWPVDHCIKCLCFYHPDDPAELKAEQQAEAAHAVRGRAQGRPRTADRDHRRQARPARRRHHRARARRALCARHQARLVEARAAGLGRGLGRRSRR